jgi:hypothetical protein
MKSGWSFRRKYFVGDHHARRPIADKRNAFAFCRDRNIADSIAEKLHKIGFSGWSFEKGGACAFGNALDGPGPSGASQWQASQGRNVVVLEILARGAQGTTHGHHGRLKSCRPATSHNFEKAASLKPLIIR